MCKIMELVYGMEDITIDTSTFLILSGNGIEGYG